MPNESKVNEVIQAPDEIKGRKSSSFKDKESDPGFLVAKGRFRVPSEESGASFDVKKAEEERRAAEKEHVKNLASAIFMAMSNCGYANVRAVGRNATYNAIKSIAIAKSFCAPRGIEICWDVSFDEGNLGVLRNKNHVETVTAMLFQLKGYREWVEEGEHNDQPAGE